MNLTFGHVKSNATGYGRMRGEFHAALQRVGVQVDQYGPSTTTAQGVPEYGNPDDKTPVHANCLWMATPPHIRGWWKGQRTHVMTMWEGNELPPAFRETFHEFDTLIVPSLHNLELFSHFHDNVRKVNLGINPENWHYRKPPLVEAEFRFLTCGQGNRKGVDIAVKAFKTVFGDFSPTVNDPTPKLIVKDRVGQHGVNGDRITEWTGTISDQDEIGLYASAHCFLGLSRGEGWGMMPFQAMAQGTPTILTDAHGQHEFAHLGVPIGYSMAPADYFLFGHAGDWWEPDIDEVCEAMWDMYLNYEDYLPMGKHAAQVIADDYTWDQQARRLIMAMGGEDILNLPDITERHWYEPTVYLYRVVTSRDCSYEINGVVHFYRAGETYYELADIKRMMFENNNLDPECLDPHEPAFSPEQISDFDKYRSRHERCPTCNQRLNSDMSLDFDDDDAMELTP